MVHRERLHETDVLDPGKPAQLGRGAVEEVLRISRSWIVRFRRRHQDMGWLFSHLLTFISRCVAGTHGDSDIYRRLAGKMISRFEDKSLGIVAMKMMRVDKDLAAEHYAEHVEKGWYPTLEGFITGGPVVAAILEGLEVIRVVRDMLGATSGLQATPGTIRGDFSSSRQMNLVHGSDGPEAAQREIALYFKAEELCDDDPTISRWLRAADELVAAGEPSAALLLLDRIDSMEYAPENKFMHQPGIMLGTLELNLKFTKSR